jgi:hypothetical protein
MQVVAERECTGVDGCMLVADRAVVVQLAVITHPITAIGLQQLVQMQIVVLAAVVARIQRTKGEAVRESSSFE